MEMFLGLLFHPTQPAITCSELTIETLDQGVKYVWRQSTVFIVNFEHISHLIPVFLLLTLIGWSLESN